MIVAIAALATSAAACMWDYDTLRDEQRGLPTVAAILAGKWEKHSDFFYEQRVERMREHLADSPDDLDAIDNLAVALEKLCRIDEAIATLEPVVAEHPDRYTAHANLGTFYIHRYLTQRDRSDLDRGIGHIERALEINPDAHFGREKYQLQVATFAREAIDDPSLLDGGSFVMPMLIGGTLDIYSEEPPEEQAERRSETVESIRIGWRGDMTLDAIDHAIEGIVGMNRFGTGTSPHLYYALGDLLAAKGDKHLAGWAYLRAIEFGHPRPEQVEEAFSQATELVSPPVTIKSLQADLDKAKAEAAEWVAAYQAYEDDLVRRGVDTTDETNYAAFYAEHGDARPALGFSLDDHLPRGPNRLIYGAILVLAAIPVVLALLLVIAWRRRRRKRPAGAFA